MRGTRDHFRGGRWARIGGCCAAPWLLRVGAHLRPCVAYRGIGDWQLIAAARAGLALVFAALLAWFGGVRLVFLRPRTLWMRSIAGSISLVCGFYALSRMPVADVLTVTNMFPIWVALLSWPLLGQAPGGGSGGSLSPWGWPAWRRHSAAAPWPPAIRP